MVGLIVNLGRKPTYCFLIYSLLFIWDQVTCEESEGGGNSLILILRITFC